MDRPLIEKVVDEIRPLAIGSRFGRVFQLSRFEYVFDLRLREGQYLFVSIEPAAPRVYIVRRKLRDLERAALPPTPFALQMRSRLANAEITDMTTVAGERVVEVRLSGVDDAGDQVESGLVIQLTGRSSNLFLTHGDGRIIAAARLNEGTGQEIGDEYAPPPRPVGFTEAETGEAPQIPPGVSVSEFLDAQFEERDRKRRFTALVNDARGKLRSEIAKREKLLANLLSDRKGHGDAEQWKRFGDLLLASAGTAENRGGMIRVVDLYDEAQPEIEIEAEVNATVTEAAEAHFRKYTKARNAEKEIAARISQVEGERESLRQRSARLEAAIEAEDEDAIRSFTGGKKNQGAQKKNEKKASSGGFARSFLSSDGFEILVGKKAKDNDYLTFRAAKSLDTWMHAADYPGSHVVVRNPGRKEIPQRTLLEAAQLAAFYSQGKKQTKAAVHYTEKKFVNKPRGAAPGLVSLSKFKTLLVEPVFPDLPSE
jgi:predicted ribosome quality control (RQC) complex YloA/Tae2 family protein